MAIRLHIYCVTFAESMGINDEDEDQPLLWENGGHPRLPFKLESLKCLKALEEQITDLEQNDNETNVNLNFNSKLKK